LETLIRLRDDEIKGPTIFVCWYVWNVLDAVKTLEYIAKFSCIPITCRVNTNVKVTSNNNLTFVQRNYFKSSRKIGKEGISSSSRTRSVDQENNRSSG